MNKAGMGMLEKDEIKSWKAFQILNKSLEINKLINN